MIQTRQDLKDYALRALGAPLVKIDITDEAMDDCIDYSLQFMQEFYYDGADRFYYAHQVTDEDVANKYITIPANIWGINSIMSFGNTAATSTSIFDALFQLRQTDVQNFMSTSLVYYSQVQSQLALVENLLVTQRQFQFNRNSDKLFINMNWNLITVGNYLMLDCYAVMDPAENSKFWNNRQFKEYVVAKFKKQWSLAYSKFDNINLPGGVTINGKQMYAEAKAELDAIEANIINNQSPLGFCIG